MIMTIELTDAQKEQLEPLLAKAAEEYQNGRPGIVIAQILKGVMLVGFLPHEKAKLFEKTGVDGKGE